MSNFPGPFGDCKNAVLQNIGEIQEIGALVAVHADSDLIEYCSANSASLLGKAPDQLLGQCGSDWLSTEWLEFKELTGQEGHREWRNFTGVVPLDAIAHRQGAHRIFEFERGGRSQHHWWNHSTRADFVEQLTNVQTVERCREFLVDWVYQRSGYDRVLMYQFLPGWDGEVTAERSRPGVGGFLGLRFPASDMPPNVRRMFTLNRQRAITDVESRAAALLRFDDKAQPLDLTYSVLRSPHPVHIQYLKNMGVQASLTLSLVVNGKLWGMIACHHLSSLAPSIQDRLAFEEMAQLVSLHLTNLLGLIEQRLHSHMRQELSRVQGAMSTASDDPKLALVQNLGWVRQTFRAGGTWLRFEGKDYFSGVVPDPASLAPLRDYIDRYPREQVSGYDILPEELRSYRALAVTASGALFIPLSSTDFLTLVRPEVIETVNWAGKPQDLDDDLQLPARQLTPRNSFITWSQRVRNSSEQWTETELAFGEKLRTDLQQFLSVARLERIALYDPLTGLANRLLFERRLRQEVRNVMTGQTTFAVLMIDLDRFKQVNDTLGHSAGDQVLRETATRLLGAVRQGDTVARLGGDEFAVLQTGLDSERSAILAAQRIVQSVSEVYTIAGNPIEIGASVGISACPADTVEEGELIECADLALYQAKRSGRSAYSVFHPTMRAAVPGTNDGHLLIQALQDGEFRLNYQPIIDGRSGELRGLEAFVRWPRAGGSDRDAQEVLSLAKQQRLGPEVGNWVMDAVFKQYRQWLQQGLPMVPISVNIGAAEFGTQDLLKQITQLAALYEIGWQWLRLDIKDATLVNDLGLAMRKLTRLRAAGVGANLDNFGSSFLPIGSLTHLPFVGIKLDAALLKHKKDRPEFNALFNIVRSVAQVLSAQLTVTRIETQEMREALANENIDFLQGYAIAHPADADQAAEWLLEPLQFMR
jgi:diguanylate cyclase (GGDEF)-like protein